jgi:hypothetical protein
MPPPSSAVGGADALAEAELVLRVLQRVRVRLVRVDEAGVAGAGVGAAGAGAAGAGSAGAGSAGAGSAGAGSAGAGSIGAGSVGAGGGEDGVAPSVAAVRSMAPAAATTSEAAICAITLGLVRYGLISDEESSGC